MYGQRKAGKLVVLIDLSSVLTNVGVVQKCPGYDFARIKRIISSYDQVLSSIINPDDGYPDSIGYIYVNKSQVLILFKYIDH